MRWYEKAWQIIKKLWDIVMRISVILIMAGGVHYYLSLADIPSAIPGLVILVYLAWYFLLRKKENTKKE